LYEALFGPLIRRTHPAVVELAGPRPGERVLDVGCGPGSLTVALRRSVGPAGSAHGIDASPEMIEAARRNASKAGLEVGFQVGVAEALPFSDGTFDLVVSQLAIHHLPDDLRPAAFGDMRRVLKPGGRCLIIDFEPPKSGVGHLVVLMNVGGDTISLPLRGAAAEAQCEPCVRPPHVGDVMTVYTGADRVRRDRGDQSIILRKDQQKLYLMCHSSKQYAELRYPVDAGEDPPKNRLPVAKNISRYDFVAPAKTEEGKIQNWPVQTFSATVTNVLRDQQRLRVSVTRSGGAAGTPVLELRKLLNEIEHVGEGWAHL